MCLLVNFEFRFKGNNHVSESDARKPQVALEDILTRPMTHGLVRMASGDGVRLINESATYFVYRCT
jgi:hypothetical protein